MLALTFFIFVSAWLFGPLAPFPIWAKTILIIVVVVSSLLIALLGTCTGDNADEDMFPAFISLLIALLALTSGLVVVWSVLPPYNLWIKLGLSIAAFIVAPVLGWFAFLAARRFCKYGPSGLIPDIAKPKWRHSDDEIRERAVETLSDQAILERVARRDRSLAVRLAAAKKLNSQHLFAEVAVHASDAAVGEGDVGREAVKLITDERLLTRVAQECDSDYVGSSAVENLSAQAHLENIATHASSPGVRAAAIGRISDRGLLRQIAARSEGEIRLAAAERLDDAKIITEIAYSDPSSSTRWNAVNTGRVHDRDLAHIATTDGSFDVRKRAAELVRNKSRLRHANLESPNGLVCPHSPRIFSWCFMSREDADRYWHALVKQPPGGVRSVAFVVRATSVVSVPYPHWVSFGYSESANPLSPADCGISTGVDYGILTYNDFSRQGRVLEIHASSRYA